MNNSIDILVDNISDMLKPFGKIHHVHEPTFLKSSIDDVSSCIKSTYVSGSGNYLNKFKKELSKYTGSKYITLTNSGTSALHLALNMIDIKNKEVLLPSMTFVATSNAISYNLGIPHFLDVQKNCINIDPLMLDQYIKDIAIMKRGKCFNKKTKNEIKCLVVLHAFGFSSDITKIKKVCSKYNIEVIEDAAGALGTKHKNKHVGTFGRFGKLSFNGNKIVTTGMGGAILSKNQKDHKRVEHLTSTARIQHLWKIAHTDIGYNYRMANINAALGLSQLKHLNTFLKNKKKLHLMYLKILTNDETSELITNANHQSNYWLNNLILKPKYKKYKNYLLKKLHEKNILARELWTPQHLLPMYRKNPKSEMKNTIDLWKRTISLPSSNYHGI